MHHSSPSPPSHHPWESSKYDRHVKPTTPVYPHIPHESYHRSHRRVESHREGIPPGQASSYHTEREEREERFMIDHQRSHDHRRPPTPSRMIREPHYHHQEYRPMVRKGEMIPLNYTGTGDYSVIAPHETVPRKHRHKIKRQRAGCCGCLNSCCCGGGCCDRPEVVNGRPGGFRPGGPWKCMNIKGCCDRERIFVRRGSSVHSWHIMNLDDTELGQELYEDQLKQKQKKGCCRC